MTTVALMIVGAIFLTANGASLPARGFTIMYIVSQFLFGYGVGVRPSLLLFSCNFWLCSSLHLPFPQPVGC